MWVTCRVKNNIFTLKVHAVNVKKYYQTILLFIICEIRTLSVGKVIYNVYFLGKLLKYIKMFWRVWGGGKFYCNYWNGYDQIWYFNFDNVVSFHEYLLLLVL